MTRMTESDIRKFRRWKKSNPNLYKREAVWRYIADEPVDNFDIDGEYAEVKGLDGEKVNPNISVSEAIEAFEDEMRRWSQAHREARKRRK